MDGKADDDDDAEEEEAATGTPALELNVGHYRQITTFIYTQVHTIMHKHTLDSVRVCVSELCDSDTHTHTGTQMNQVVNTKCLLSERLQNKSCFQLLPLPLASTLIFALGTCRRSHTHTCTNTHQWL